MDTKVIVFWAGMGLLLLITGLLRKWEADRMNHRLHAVAAAADAALRAHKGISLEAPAQTGHLDRVSRGCSRPPCDVHARAEPHREQEPLRATR